MLSFRFVGVSLLRYEESRFAGSLLIHDPPRNTRVRPPLRFRARTSLVEIRKKFSPRCARKEKRVKG
jgi:hypothetical protein